MRYLLEANGGNILTYSDDTYPVKTFGHVLSDPIIAKAFGDDLVYYFKMLFVDGKVDIFFDAYVINKTIDDLSDRTEDRQVYQRYIDLADTQEYKWFKILDFDLLRRRYREKRNDESWQDFNRRYETLKTAEILNAFDYTQAAPYLPVFDVLGDCGSHSIWPFHRQNNAAQILLNHLIETRRDTFIELFKSLLEKPYFYQIIRYEVLFLYVQKAGNDLLETVEKIIFGHEYINFQYVRVGFFNSPTEANITIERCKRYKELLSSLKGWFYLYLGNVHFYTALDPGFLNDVLPFMLDRAGKSILEFRLEEDFIEKNYSLFNSIEIARKASGTSTINWLHCGTCQIIYRPYQKFLISSYPSRYIYSEVKMYWSM
ncbi:hypothetical protein [Mucilaginibacter gossypiicola]|nr:hypothetical protein [Mucilaginibacter gossypiicola]